MYKIAVIGDKDSVLGFRAAGFTTFFASSSEQAREALHKAASSGEYAIVFLTDDLCEALSDEIERYRSEPIPAIIPLPSKNGSSGYGMAGVKRSVERAVGADILFKN